MKLRLILSTSILLSCHILLAQYSDQIPGVWTVQGQYYTLELSDDSRYMSTDATGTSYHGTYTVSGSQLLLTGAYQGQTSTQYYDIISIRDHEMTLRNNGLDITLTRSMSYLSSESSADRGDVITSRGGYDLTTSDIQTMRDVLEFVIDGQLSPSEREVVRQEGIDEFHADPATARQNYDDIKAFLDGVRSSGDVLEIGAARQMFYSIVYGDHLRDMRAGETSPTLSIIFDRVPVAYYDAAHQIAITERDILSLTKCINFYTLMAGGQDQVGVDAVRSEIGRLFDQMSVDQKNALAMSSVTWDVIEYNWARLTPAQKQQLATQSQSQMQSWSSPTMYDTSSSEMTWDQYRTLSNMMLESHVTTLNCIENIGGSGDYWEIRYR